MLPLSRATHFGIFWFFEPQPFDVRKNEETPFRVDFSGLSANVFTELGNPRQGLMLDRAQNGTKGPQGPRDPALVKLAPGHSDHARPFPEWSCQLWLTTDTSFFGSAANLRFRNAMDGSKV